MKLPQFERSTPYRRGNQEGHDGTIKYGLLIVRDARAGIKTEGFAASSAVARRLSLQQ